MASEGLYTGMIFLESMPKYILLVLLSTEGHIASCAYMCIEQSDFMCTLIA
jgi:hypothetical protein